jgi:putative transcriptional regulator
MKTTNLLLRLVVVGMLGWSGLLQGADLSDAVVLVANPQFRDEPYTSSVLVVRALGQDQHVGFIVNRPTPFTLGGLFPEHAPSQKVIDPLYLGGPFSAQHLFALVQRPDSPGGNSFEVLPGLYVAFDGATVDRIIESQPDQARFVAGMVAWQPGELRDEIKRGLWYVLEPDAALALRKPIDGLWEELVRRSEFAAKGI